MDFLFYLLCIVGGLLAALGVVLFLLGNPSLKRSKDEQGPEGD